ncbi:AAA family ATPase [Allorhizobium pseudoryzae]|uniref:AAA family ATPase n=1 Tax=Allorhizobium pseudoryzae TaxID=379684 RepID=UPI003D002F5E
MNQQITTSPSTGWERPEPSGQFLEKHSADDIAIWQKLTESVAAIAISNGFSKSEVQRRIGMQNSTFSQWFSGTYIGRLETYNRMAEQWISAFIEASGTISTIRQSPLFIQTRLSREIFDTLVWAQTTADMVMVTVGAGMGKTMACRTYAATRPHVYHATVSPHTKTVHGMLVELASELDVREHNPAKLTRAIGAKLGRIGGGSLLIVDEAQNLVDDAINQLRHFMDIYHCGIALVGNDEVYTRFGRTNGGPSYAQLKRRIGKRLNRAKPYAEDLQAYIAAWGVTDPECIKFLTGVGLKGGALGQIDKTTKLAFMVAEGMGQPLALDHLKEAWRNRDVEDIA